MTSLRNCAGAGRLPAGFRLRIDYSASFDHWAALSEGAYLLRQIPTGAIGSSGAYIQLTQLRLLSVSRKIS